MGADHGHGELVDHRGRVLDELQRCLATDLIVEHSTIQFEAASHAAHELGMHA